MFAAVSVCAAVNVEAAVVVAVSLGMTLNVAVSVDVAVNDGVSVGMRTGSSVVSCAAMTCTISKISNTMLKKIMGGGNKSAAHKKSPMPSMHSITNFRLRDINYSRRLPYAPKPHSLSH